VGKNKLARWTELGSFDKVFQPRISDISSNDHAVKGRWKTEIFKNNHPVILELGCGKGEYSVGLATRFPENNYIGIDIKGARMWRGAKTADERKLPNIAFLRTRIEFINSFFTEDEIDEIWITFPDPHSGPKNSNKRLTSPWFLNIYRNFLKNNGSVHLKTDNTELYNFTIRTVAFNNLEVISATEDLHEAALTINNNIPHDILSIRTHYENLFMNKGQKINFISFRLNKEKIIENASSKAKKE
jgi:tRNA (guanine-N7-)-methyltransferase